MTKDGNAYTIISDNTVKYYRKINQTYTYIGQIGSVCYNAVDCGNSRQWLSTDGLYLFYVHHNATSTLQVVQILNYSTLIFLQNISFAGSLASVYGTRYGDRSGVVTAKSKYLLMSIDTAMAMYGLNSSGYY
jgi:hypothetical protein